MDSTIVMAANEPYRYTTTTTTTTTTNKQQQQQQQQQQFKSHKSHNNNTLPKRSPKYVTIFRHTLSQHCQLYNNNKTNNINLMFFKILFH
jgi:hypothetical protein